MYEIDKEVPMPTTLKGYGPKYPFGKMKVGDSFSFAKEELAKIRAASAYYGVRNEMKFKVAKSELRCWRIS